MKLTNKSNKLNFSDKLFLSTSSYFSIFNRTLPSKKTRYLNLPIQSDSCLNNNNTKINKTLNTQTIPSTTTQTIPSTTTQTIPSSTTQTSIKLKKRKIKNIFQSIHRKKHDHSSHRNYLKVYSSTPYLESLKNTANSFKQTRFGKQFNTSFSPPSIEEMQTLNKFYQVSRMDDEHHYIKNNYEFEDETATEKENREKIFGKFEITNKLNKNEYKFLPKLDDSVQIHIKKNYFNSLNNACHSLKINKQIENKVNLVSNHFLIERYSNRYKNVLFKKYVTNKMPKVKIKNLETENENDFSNPFTYIINQAENNNFNINSNNDFNNNNKNNNDESNKNNNLFNSNFVDKCDNRQKEFIINKHDLLDDMQNKEVIFNRHNKQTHIEIYMTKSVIKFSIRPSNRYYFTLCRKNKLLFLFGGLNYKYNNDFWIYHFHEKMWEEIKLANPPVPRYGHTCVCISDYLIFFGGVTQPIYSNYNEVLIYDINNQKLISQAIRSKFKIGIRRGHVAVVVSYTMLIQGGYNLIDNKLENSAFIYTYFDNKCDILLCKGRDLPYLMNHSGVYVNVSCKNYEDEKYSIYQYPEAAKHNIKINEEGIFLFGGMDENRNFKNDLYIIKIGRKPCFHFKAKTSGNPPSPRINCQMIYNSNLNLVFIHGGADQKQNILNDVYILNPYNLNYVKPILMPDNLKKEAQITARTEHQMFDYNGKLYIVGGRNDKQCIPLDFEILSFKGFQ